MHYSKRMLCGFVCFAAAFSSATWAQSSTQPSTQNGEWPHYTADLKGTKYSPLSQIDASNFNQLEVAWRFKTDNLGPRPENKLEGTPIMVNGMVYATAGGEDPTPEIIARLGVLRVATKYPQVAEAHFLATGRQVELVKVNGSVELGPLVGLADGIVDLVATGRTLRENGLVEREQIFSSSARLIANRVSHKLRAEDIDALTARLAQAVAAEVA